MKVTNETKIGALTSIAIVLLILGFNFLKGKDLFSHSKKFYAVFKNVEGLELSNTVSIKGLNVGNVYAIKATDKNIDGILVTISMKQDVNIPKNSIATINAGLINSSNIIIKKGDAAEYLQDGDTLATLEKGGILTEFQASLNPVINTLNSTLSSLDSLIEVVGGMFNPALKNNFTTIIANLARSSASLQVMLNDRTSSLARSMVHLDSFTNNLANNNQRITGTLDNLEKTTNKLANAKIDETLQSAQSTMNALKDAINKINSTDGTMGLLLNDKKLYLNLENTARSLNILLDDLRMHPKRYVNISVFGKKDKGNQLMAPLNDTSSVNQPKNK
jgi:phospholipid/cholesterol/gamma-HCH transport system substrate-binding protein